MNKLQCQSYINVYLLIIHIFLQIEAALSDEMTKESILLNIDNFYESFL